MKVVHVLIAIRKVMMIKYFKIILLLFFTGLFADDIEIVNGKITYITVDQVYCDIGSKQNIVIGDTLKITRRGDFLGSVIVSHVATNSSVSDKISSQIEFQLGDIVILQINDNRNIVNENNINIKPIIVDNPIEKPKQNIKFSQHGTISLRTNYNTISNELMLYQSLQYGLVINNPFPIHLFAFGQSNSNTGKFILYQAKLDFGSRKKGIFVQAGRVFTAELSGIGATDGILTQWRKNKSYSIGALFGFQPDNESYKPNYLQKKIGVYSTINKKLNNLTLNGTGSIVGQYEENIPQREYLFFKIKGRYKSNLEFNIWQLNDFYRDELNNTSNLELTSSQLSVRYKAIFGIVLQSKYSMRIQPLYFTNYESTQDSLISNEIRSGWLNSIRFSIPKIGQFQIGSNIRIQNSSEMAYLLRFNYQSHQIKEKYILGWNLNWIKNDIINGIQNKFQYDWEINNKKSFFLEYELYQYGYGVNPFDFIQHSFSISFDQSISKHLYFYSAFDFIIDGQLNQTFIFSGLSYRI